ncbi:hypothetical protein PHMEG_00022203, partial [Phytophthora megakarya]
SRTYLASVSCTCERHWLAPATPAATCADTPSPVTRVLDLGGAIKFMKSGFLPSSHASSQGHANIKPTHAVLPPKRGLDADSFVVGVPVHADAYRSDTHVQDGYGGVENLLVFAGLSNQDLDDICADCRLSIGSPQHGTPPLALEFESEASEDEEIAVSDGDDGAPEQASKSEEKPPASSLPSETSVPDATPTEKSSSGNSTRKPPSKQSHRSSKTIKIIEMETPHGTCFRFPDFLTLVDLRQDTLLTMQAGFGYSLSVKMMGDNAVAHHEFLEADLCNMLTQMMYDQCLDETLWIRYVPDKYFRMAEVVLRRRLLADDYPLDWPKFCNVKDDSLSAHETIEIGESEEEDDPADEN